MKCKSFYKIVMLLSCFSLVTRATNAEEIVAYEIRIRTLGGNILETVSLDLTQKEINSIRNGEYDGLQKRLKSAFNDPNPYKVPFYDFSKLGLTGPTEVSEHGLTSQIMVSCPKFLFQENKLFLLEPELEQQVYISFKSLIQLNPSYHHDLSEFSAFLPNMISEGVWAYIDKCSLFYISHYSELSELRQTVIFARSLAEETGREFNDVLKFLSSLVDGFSYNQYSITRHQDDGQYSINLINKGLVASLRFLDNSDNKWYTEKYSEHRSDIYGRTYKNPLHMFSRCPREKLYLLSITFGNQTYEFNNLIDLTKDKVFTRIKNAMHQHVFNMFYGNGPRLFLIPPHRQMGKLFNKLSLSDVMRSIEHRLCEQLPTGT